MFAIASSIRHLELTAHDDLLRATGGPGAWNELVDASVYPNVFLRWEWIESWWKWFGRQRPLELLVVHNGSDLVGIVPLHVSSPGRLGVRPRTLSFLGAGGPTSPEYLGPIVHREYVDEVIERVVQHLASRTARWDVLELLDTAPDDAGTQTLMRRLAERYPTIRQPGEVCQYIHLPDSLDALLGRLTSHGRRRRRAELRKAREEHQARLEFVDRAERLTDVFPIMVELSAASRGREYVPSPFHNADYAGFHREVLERLLPEGIAKLAVLSLDGRPAAFGYGFAYHGKFYYFQTGFDTKLDKLSPGGVLFLTMCEQLLEQGIVELDYLRGDHSYKSVYADDARHTETVRVFRQPGAAYLDRWCRTHVVTKLRAWAKAKSQRAESGEQRA